MGPGAYVAQLAVVLDNRVGQAATETQVGGVHIGSGQYRKDNIGMEEHWLKQLNDRHPVRRGTCVA